MTTKSLESLHVYIYRARLRWVYSRDRYSRTNSVHAEKLNPVLNVPESVNTVATESLASMLLNSPSK